MKVTHKFLAHFTGMERAHTWCGTVVGNGACRADWAAVTCFSCLAHARRLGLPGTAPLKRRLVRRKMTAAKHWSDK